MTEFVQDRSPHFPRSRFPLRNGWSKPCRSDVESMRISSKRHCFEQPFLTGVNEVVYSADLLDGSLSHAMISILLDQPFRTDAASLTNEDSGWTGEMQRV